MRTILILSIIFCLGCNYESGNTQNKTTENIKDSINENVIVLDSLSDPTSFYYLSNKPIKEIAHLILIDSIRPSDNKITFDCVDSSLYSKNKVTRDFYFPVFMKILNQSDGALSESLSDYVVKYIVQYPNEFFERMKKNDEKYFDTYAYLVGYNLLMSENGGVKWLNSLNDLCIGCDAIQMSKIERFKKIAKKVSDEIIEE